MPRKGLFFCRRLILWGEGNFLFSFAHTSEKEKKNKKENAL